LIRFDTCYLFLHSAYLLLQLLDRAVQDNDVVLHLFQGFGVVRRFGGRGRDLSSSPRLFLCGLGLCRSCRRGMGLLRHWSKFHREVTTILGDARLFILHDLATRGILDHDLAKLIEESVHVLSGLGG